MRMNALQIISAKYLGGALLLLVLISASPSLADDPRAAQKRLNQADQALQAKTNEVVQATKGLERSIDIAKKRLNQLEVEGRLKDFEKMVKESRKHEEEAVEEAKKALEAAKRCDKLAFDQLSKKADGLLKKAKKTDDERKKFVKDMDEPVIKIDQLTRLGDTEQEEYKKAAEAAGFGDRFASVMNNFEKQKGALQREFEKQQEKLDTLQKAWEDLESKRSDIAKANAKLDEFGRPVSRPEEAESYLREGKALRDEPCPSAMVPGGAKAPTAAFLASAAIGPSSGAAGPGAPVDMTVVVDSRPTILICILPGVEPDTVAAALGLADYQVIATTATGTIIAAYGDPQTIDEAEARDKGIPLCFVEINFCVIKAPLTAFRGHEHKAHPGGIHNHDAPDPPWSWSVTPPEPVVSWGGR
jgi:hypothetical protein